ncbi:MAG: nicotianamine synthase family protein [Pseudomonadota bacterium]
MSDLCSEIGYLKKSYNFLSNAKDMSPCNEDVNTCLYDLVTTLSQWQGRPIVTELLSSTELEAVRNGLPELCGQAECEMEKFWAKRLLGDKNLKQNGLSSFWYFEHYKNLCAAENELVDFGQYDRISFLGSGALPLTAYFAAEACPHAEIKCVDCDCDACDLALDLVDTLGLSRQIEIIQKQALDYTPKDRELVICASLLTGHGDLYKNLIEQQIESLLIRDAEDIYQFLYKPASRPDLPYRKMAQTSPTPERINTTLFYTSRIEGPAT